MRLRSLPDEDERVVAWRSEDRRPLTASTAEGVVDPVVAAALDPAGPLAASIGRLRLQLAAVRRADGTPACLVAIADVDAADEAALLAAALAVATAQAGYQTLLVDACIARPTLHPLFGLGNTAGLTTLLPTRLAGDAIQRTGQPGLSLLAAGPRATGDESMLDGARLFGRLRTMTDRFQSVLVLGAGDPGLLVATSEGFDGAMLVVRRDVSSARRLQAAAAALADGGTPLIGVVRVD